jgi:hypothetical protein
MAKTDGKREDVSASLIRSPSNDAYRQNMSVPL